MSLHLATLILLASSTPAATDYNFEPNRQPEPPTPDPTWGQGAGAMLLLPVPRKGRECPTCLRIVPVEWRRCKGSDHQPHAWVKTRKVTLDGQGRPVRRRK